MSIISKIAPSSASIQKEYVEKRKRALFANDDQKTEAVKAKIEALLARKNVTADWHETYLRIHRGLQAANLTINLEAGSWFFNENNYDTYAQMYERGIGADGKMVIDDSDKKNPAAARAIVDDLVTIPDEWAGAGLFSQRRRLRKALHATGATNASNKELGNPSQAARPKLVGGGTQGYTTTNKNFKPKAKQVFAALNYGNRPHGSSTYYGFSYMVLKPGLKDNAIFFGGDTFYKSSLGTAAQASFNTVGAIIQFAVTKLQNALWDGCYNRQLLPDTDDGDYLVEAHLFKKLKIAEDVQALVLSRLRESKHTPWTDAEWQGIIVNATKWCKRNHVMLVFASP